MRENLRFLFYLLAGLAVASIVCTLAEHHRSKQSTLPQPVIDTLIVRDTIRVTIPTYVAETLLSVVRVPVNVLNPCEPNAVGKSDTVVHTDTVWAELPLTQKRYTDSLYTAWVSGYHPSLDSIYIHRPTIYVKTTEASPKREKRWHFGLQGGVGMTPKGVLPYVGVGVGIKFF